MEANVAIVYTSYGGNTRDLAEMIKSMLERYGVKSRIFSNRDVEDLSEYKYIIIGSLTWDNSKLPIQMRRFLKEVLITNPQINCKCSVFGTGETQWGQENFCRGVDELQYHLQKNGVKVDHILKIEQHPIGKENKIKSFVENVLEEIEL